MDFYEWSVQVNIANILMTLELLKICKPCSNGLLGRCRCNRILIYTCVIALADNNTDDVDDVVVIIIIIFTHLHACTHTHTRVILLMCCGICFVAISGFAFIWSLSILCFLLFCCYFGIFLLLCTHFSRRIPLIRLQFSSINRRPLTSSHVFTYAIRTCLSVNVFAWLYFAWLKLGDALLCCADRTRDRTIFIVFRLDITYQFILFVLSRLTMCVAFFSVGAVVVSVFFRFVSLLFLFVVLYCYVCPICLSLDAATLCLCCCLYKLLTISIYRLFIFVFFCLNSQIKLN